MDLGVRRWAGWVLLMSLVYGPGFAGAGDGPLVRHGRQADRWESYKRAALPRGSSSWGSRPLTSGSRAVVGFGAQQGTSGSRGAGLSRQVPAPVASPANSPVSVQCGEDSMVVNVVRDLFGTRKLVNPSDLTLGPQGCQPSGQTTDVVTFQINLQDCGNTVQMNQDWVIYSTALTYNPTSSIPIIRTNAAEVTITCYYYRHYNVSSSAIKPTWAPFSSTVSAQDRLSFSLGLMTADWSGPSSSSVFRLGDVLYIEASVDSQNHVDMMLYVDRCVATLSSDPTSTPSYDIITDNGCLVDGTQEDVSSVFLSPRVQSDKLRFMVDVFRFLDADASLIYITCYLRAAAATQVPDSMNKACSYSKGTQSWSAVEGPSSVCQCCSSPGSCSNPTQLVAGGRSRFGRPRGFGKREALDGPHVEEGETLTTLGPLFVIGPKQRNIASAMIKEESASVELWVLVTLGGLSLLTILVAAVIIGKSLTKPHHVLSENK